MEDVKTSDAFYYIWLYHLVLGLYTFNPDKRLFYLYSLAINIPNLILQPVSYIFYFSLEKVNIDEILRVLQDYLSILAALAKFVILYFHIGQMRIIDKDLDALEKHPRFSSKDRDKIRRMVKVSNCLMLCYFICFNSLLIFYCWTTFQKSERALMLQTWFPYDWNANNFVYWATFVYQFFVSTDAVNRNVSTDAYVPMYLMALGAHFDILVCRFKQIGYGEQTLEENYEELMDCIKLHRKITNIFDRLSDIISKTIICQFTLSAFTICATLAPFFIWELSLMQTLRTFVLAIVLVLQIFPSCYYGDRLMEMTENFTTDLYKCNWPDQSPEFKKVLMIFMTLTQEKKAILVGKLMPVNLVTLMGILKTAYTFMMFMVQVA